MSEPRPVPAATASEPYFELQFHPANPARRLRRLLMGRRELRWAKALFGLWLAFLLAGLLSLPSALSLVAAGNDQKVRARNVEERRELRSRVEELDAFHARSERLSLALGKLAFVLGLDRPAPGPAPRKRDSKLAPGQERELAEGGLALLGRIEVELGRAGRRTEQIEELAEREPERLRTSPTIAPLPAGSFVLTGGFGRRKNPFTLAEEFHCGVDLAAHAGTPIRAPADGTVRFAGSLPEGGPSVWWKLGKLVAIEHPGGTVTLYGHCDTLGVAAGQHVRRGDTLGTVGKTGWCLNPQLYYEVRRRGADGALRPVDPRLFVADHQWDDDERLLEAPPTGAGNEDFEPLPF